MDQHTEFIDNKKEVGAPSIKQRPIEGVYGAPANHRATRQIVNS